MLVIADCDTNITFTAKFKKSPNSADPEICDEDPFEELPFVSSDATTTIVGTPGVLTGANRYRIQGMPLGRTWVRFYLKDGCGNETITTTEIDVIDKTPPVAVCDEYTVVTLSNNGFARVFANTFDDGSHDNCTPVGFQVSRMNAGCGDRDENPLVERGVAARRRFERDHRFRVVDHAHNPGGGAARSGGRIEDHDVGLNINGLPDLTPDHERHGGLRQIIAGDGCVLDQRPAEIGGVELQRDRRGMAGLDPALPSSRRGASATGSDVLDFQRRVAGVGEDKCGPHHRADRHLAKLKYV